MTTEHRSLAAPAALLATALGGTATFAQGNQTQAPQTQGNPGQQPQGNRG